MKTGFHISIDGSNFSGKTSVIDSFSTRMKEQESLVDVSRGVSESLIGKFININIDTINQNPQAFALLIAADKYFSHGKYIASKIERGTFLISDRYLLSSFAYQYLDGMPFDFTWNLYESFPKPDLNILLMVSSKALTERMKGRREPLSNTELKFSRENEMQAFIQAANYLVLKGLNIVQIENETRPVAETVSQIMSVLTEHYPRK